MRQITANAMYMINACEYLNEQYLLIGWRTVGVYSFTEARLTELTLSVDKQSACRHLWVTIFIFKDGSWRCSFDIEMRRMITAEAESMIRTNSADWPGDVFSFLHALRKLLPNWNV